jgi:hypothetical protein
MSNTHPVAFLAAYMSKEAKGEVLGAASSAAKWVADNALLATIIAPLAVGAGAGALASHATSPDKLDQKALQNKLHSLELKEFRTQLERRKKLAKRKGINESTTEVSGGRSLRI